MYPGKALLNRYAPEQDSSVVFPRDYSIAALLGCDPVLAATQEERFTWKKHDSLFPPEPPELSAVDYYDNPVLPFDRAFKSLLSVSPLPQDKSPKAFTYLPRLKFRIRKIVTQALGLGGTVI